MSTLHRPVTPLHEDVLLSLLSKGHIRGARTVLSSLSPPAVNPQASFEGTSLLGWALRCNSWRAMDGRSAGRTSKALPALPLTAAQPWPDISAWEAAPWVAAVLLANGVDPWLPHPDPSRATDQIDAFDGAIQWGQPALVSAMLRHPSAPPVNDIMRRPPPIDLLPGRVKPPSLFHALCAAGDATMVAAFIQAGGDAQMLDEEGRSALFWATTPDVVACLLGAGVDPAVQVKRQDASAFWFDQAKKEPAFWGQRMDERLKVLREAGFSQTADRTETIAITQVFEAVDALKWPEAASAAQRFLGLPEGAVAEGNPVAVKWLTSLRRNSTKGVASKLGGHSIIAAAACRYLRGVSNRKTGLLRSLLNVYSAEALSVPASADVQGWGFAWLAIHSIDTAGYSQLTQSKYRKVLVEKAEEIHADPTLMLFEQSLLAAVWAQPRLSTTAASNARSVLVNDWIVDWKGQSRVTQDDWVEMAARQSDSFFALNWWPDGALSAVHQVKLAQGEGVLRQWAQQLMGQVVKATNIKKECLQKLEPVRLALHDEDWSDPAFAQACLPLLEGMAQVEVSREEVAQWRSCFIDASLNNAPRQAAPGRAPRF